MSSKKGFGYEIGELVLVKWEDGMVYFAKIKKIDWRRKQCVVIFDDKSTDKATFSQIHSVDETTTDIICIKCKKDNSEYPNEIVLCDGCGIGFHQKCHSPTIPASALELDNPWKCVYCLKGLKNPYLTESIDVLQSLFEEDNDTSPPQQQQQKSTAEPSSQPAVPVVVKQECLSDDDDDSTYSMEQSTTPAIPSSTTSMHTKKRKSKHSNDVKKSQTTSKRRPLQELRRKFARSRLGRSTSIIISQHKRTLHDEKQCSGDTASMEETAVQHETTIKLRKRKVTDRNHSSTNTSSSESCNSSCDESLVDKAPSHVQKRPRSLRVSLTLPPSVETTPISNRPTPLSISTSKLNSFNVTSDAIANTPPTFTEQPELEEESPEMEIMTNGNELEMGRSLSPEQIQQPQGIVSTDVNSVNDTSTVPNNEKLSNDTITWSDTTVPTSSSPVTESRSPTVITNGQQQVPPNATSTTSDLTIQTETTQTNAFNECTISIASTVTPIITATCTSTVMSPTSSTGAFPGTGTPPIGTAISPTSTGTGTPSTGTAISPTSTGTGISPTGTAISSTGTGMHPTSTGSTHKRCNSTDESSLVKMSPGVTHLKPTKHKRPSIISDTPLPPPKTSCVQLSPLEKLRFAIVASNRLETQNNRVNKVSSTSSSSTTVLQSTGTISSAPPIQSHHSRKSSAPSRTVSRCSSNSSANVGSSIATQTTMSSKPIQSKNPDNLIVISPSPSPPPLPPSLPQTQPPSLPISGGPSTHPQLMAYYVNHKGHPHVQTSTIGAGSAGADSTSRAEMSDARPKVGEHYNSNKMLLPSLRQHQSKGYVTFHHSYKTSGKNTTNSVGSGNSLMDHHHQQLRTVASRPRVSKFTSPPPPVSGMGGGQAKAGAGSGQTMHQTISAPLPHDHLPPLHVVQQNNSTVAAVRPSNVNHPHHQQNQQAIATAIHQQHRQQQQVMAPQYQTVVAASPVQNDQQQLALLTSPKSSDQATVYAIVTASQQAIYDAHGNGYIMSTPTIQQVASHNVPPNENLSPVVVQRSIGQQIPGGQNGGSILYAAGGVPVGMATNAVPNPTVAPELLRQPLPPPTHNLVSSAGINNQSASVYTTKPCAVVNAIPTQVHEYKTMSPPLCSPPPPSLKSTPPPKKTISIIEQSPQEVSSNLRKRIQAQMREEATTDLSQRLHSFSNKYKDFDTLSANDLMDIFHGALKKFQRNSMIYDAYTNQTHSKKIAPPNVQVCSHPVEVQQAKLGSNSASVSYTPVSHGRYNPRLPQQYTATPGNMQKQHAADHSMPIRTNRASHQVHSTGVFIPPSALDKSETTPTIPPMYKIPEQHQHQQHHTTHSQQAKLQPPRGIPLKQPAVVSSSNTVSSSKQSTTLQSQSVNSYSTASTGMVKQSNDKTNSLSIPTSSVTVSANTSVSQGIGNISSSTAQQYTTTTTTNGGQKPTTEKRRRKPETPANIHQIRTMQAAQNSGSIARNASPEKLKESAAQRKCEKCGKLATFLCSGCHGIWYCGRDCQVSSWNEHAATCKPK